MNGQKSELWKKFEYFQRSVVAICGSSTLAVVHGSTQFLQRSKAENGANEKFGCFFTTIASIDQMRKKISELSFF